MLKKKTKEKYSKEYLTHLMLRDFIGKLTPDEIEIAKANGLLKWDLWNKATALLQGQPWQGVPVAPVFDGYGNLKPGRYPADVKFTISNYEELNVFETKIKPRTIEQKARRKQGATSVAKESKLVEIQPVPPLTGAGGKREGAGRPRVTNDTKS